MDSEISVNNIIKQTDEAV